MVACREDDGPGDGAATGLTLRRIRLQEPRKSVPELLDFLGGTG
jgi:hypothetical protein